VLSIFRTNQFLVGIFLLVYIVVVRSMTFVAPVDFPITSQGIWGKWIIENCVRHSLSVAIVTAFLIFIQGMLLNRLVAKYRMADEVTLFPGIFYALLCSMIPEFQTLTPLLIANTFYILLLMEFFRIYRTPNVADTIFNIGILIALASFFHFSFVILLIWAFITLSVLRTFNLKEALMITSGFFVIYFLAAVFYFWHDALPLFMQQQILDNISFFDINIENNWVTYISRVLFGLLIVMVIISYSSYNFKKNIQVQKYLTVLYWGLFVSVLPLFFQKGLGMDQLLIFTVPLSILISFNFVKMSSSVAEALHLLWLAAILSLHYHTFLGF
jgi:hypothetical protein